ncbi:FecR domain-containing protein [Pseudomonas sp. Sample_9]|uniref:FecR domain-containing protein n=1 Tax=Pseudomonas sp. Sample_9 TaxID=2382158 RepID=UPI0010328D29|nr:FecR domain-containing protein [Pseudomonas sp. Sample_9]
MRVAPSDETREVARAAAQWLALLESGGASDEDHARLQYWRASDSRHENAWQKIQQLRQRFAGLPPTLAMATLDRPDPARRAALKRALGVAALVPAAWLISRELPLEVWRADLHTSTGERRKVQLAQDSSLQLNTDSAVNVDLPARQLSLIRGEMALNVAGDSAFIVNAAYGRMIVNHSDISVRLNARDCQVCVLRGSVPLQPLQGPSLVLQQGQQVSLQASGAGAVTAFDALMPGWRDGVLMAQNQALGDFLRELSRYRSGVLRWDPALESLRITGSFRLDDTDQVLALLAASLPVDVHRRTRFWVSLVTRAEKTG